MDFEEENRLYREIVGERTDFYLIISHPSLSKRSIRAMGIDAYKNGVQVGTFTPKWHNIVYMMYGELNAKFGNEVVSAKEGEILITPANIERTLYSTSKEAAWIWIHLEDLPIYTNLTSEGIKARKFSKGEDLVQLYKMLRSEPEGSMLQTSYIEIICEKYLRILVDHQLKPYEAEFNLIWQKVRAQPNIPWSVEMLCKELKISRGHLHKLCTSYFKLSPMDIISGIRLEYGAFLLKATTKIIDDIAYECGFSSARSFSKAFLKKYQMRPGKFRKQ